MIIRNYWDETSYRIVQLTVYALLAQDTVSYHLRLRYFSATLNLADLYT